jgi:hypothetical protein
MNISEDIKYKLILKERVRERLNEILLTEGAKDVLTKKQGYDESVGDYLIELAGKLAVWVGNGIINQEVNEMNSGGGHWAQGLSRMEFAAKISKLYIRQKYSGPITEIMDWIKHPLVEKQDLSKMSLLEALSKSREFHKELEAVGGDIDFKEENEIVKKYPSEDGSEYYWVKIDSNFCDKESKRMGHCGRSARGNILYSLRSIKPYGKGHTISDSHVTIAFNPNDRKILQAKGKKNQKPSERYFPYIFDFIKYLAENNLFLGFGSEYASDEDYGWDDMTKEQIDYLYKFNPDIFSSYRGKKMLIKMGYDITLPSGIVDIKIDVDDLGDYINNIKYNDNIFTKYLGGDYHHSYGYDSNDGWSYVNYNSENENRILSMIRGHVGSGDAGDMTMDDLDSNSFEGILKQYFSQDVDVSELRDIINKSYEQCLGDAQYLNVIKGIKSALEEYGEVQQLNDEGAIIRVDVLNILSANMEDDVLNQLMDDVNGDLVYAFRSAVVEGFIGGPKLYINEDSYCDSDNFNEILSDRLGEID